MSNETVAASDLTRPQRVPDILDVIAALSSDAVPTPPLLARALLDILPAELWCNPEYRWLDPATKSGSILREAARRLMVGLTEWEPDPAKRAEHILRNMLYGCGITQVHGDMTRRSVYVSRDATSQHSLVKFDDSDGNLPFVHAEHDYPVNKQGKAVDSCKICGAPVGLDRGQSRENYAYAFIHGAYPTEEMNGMQFDVIVGNPPYQLGLDDNTRSKPIYHHFVERSIALAPKYLAMIVPSRWFSGGLGLDEFRTKMIADRRVRAIVDNPKLFDCFPGVEIKGGVNYFLWDRDYEGDCEFSVRVDGVIQSTQTRDLRDGAGVLIRDNNATPIVAKVVKKTKKSVESVCSATLPFGIRDNHPTRTAKQHGDVPVLHGAYVGYIERDLVPKNIGWADRWKVLIPMAGDGHGREVSYVLGEPIAVAPGSICSLTYMVAGMFDTREETENFAYYLSTKFARFLILQRKLTQHVTPDRLRFVPLLDMTRRWNDADLYAHFGLTEDEAKYIEESIHPREPILSLDSPIPASHLPGGAKYRIPGFHDERLTPDAVENEK
jgi:site-specific DNA-methyltransferase (adenine-specific)